MVSIFRYSADVTSFHVWQATRDTCCKNTRAPHARRRSTHWFPRMSKSLPSIFLNNYPWVVALLFIVSSCLWRSCALGHVDVVALAVVLATMYQLIRAAFNVADIVFWVWMGNPGKRKTPHIVQATLFWICIDILGPVPYIVMGRDFCGTFSMLPHRDVIDPLFMLSTIASESTRMLRRKLCRCNFSVSVAVGEYRVVPTATS